jgi:hypothetical protein
MIEKTSCITNQARDFPGRSNMGTDGPTNGVSYRGACSRLKRVRRKSTLILTGLKERKRRRKMKERVDLPQSLHQISVHELKWLRNWSFIAIKGSDRRVIHTTLRRKDFLKEAPKIGMVIKVSLPPPSPPPPSPANSDQNGRCRP